MSIEQLIVGESTAIRELRDSIRLVAPSTIPVLIQGPTGSGKELVATALHRESRREGSLVSFNVCAIGDTMFEDALFGHVRGAFTGAVNDSLGFLREADRGTVFFDEISGLALPMQTKLLRAVETGEFRPVGARHDVRSRFRLVAATNERVVSLVRDGRFRADLMHRIAGVTLEVPPLYARREDVPHLVAFFASGMGLPELRLNEAASRLLHDHHWPGNVRELRNVVQSCAVQGGFTASRIERVLATRRELGEVSSLDAGLRSRLLDALAGADWNTLMVAKGLGIHRTTLYRRMKALGIKVPRGLRELGRDAFMES